MLNNENFVWNVSGAFSHDDILLSVFDFIKEYSGEDLFKSVHGSIPCKFNSGRRSVSCTLDYIRICIDEYHKRKINVYYTFSNFLLREEDVNDFQCNEMLKLLLPGDGVIISSKFLFDYVKLKYPHLKLISSVLNSVNYLFERNEMFYNELLGQYNKIVIHPDDNIKFAMLDKIEDKSRCEILVNERCIQNCLYRYQHDKLLCQESLEPNLKNAKACIDFSKRYCIAFNEKKFIKLMQRDCKFRSARLNNSEINILYNNGFTNFKLQGRADSPASFTFDLCKYLIDERYQDLLFNMIVKNFSFCSKKSELKLINL